MSAAELTTRSSREEWRAGWGVVLAATLGVALATSHYHLFGVMMKPMEEAYGWSRGQLVFGLTLITGVHTFINLVVGQLVDRFGPRPIALWGSVMFGVAMCALGFAGPELWTWYAACVVFALLTANTGIIVWTSGVVRRFTRQRGLALATSLIGSGVMVAVVPTLALWLLETVGVRGVFFVIGSVGAVLILVLTWCFFLEEPGADPVETAKRTGMVPQVLPGMAVKEVLSTLRFWQLSLAVALMSVCLSAFVVHLQPMLGDAGMAPATAATVAFFVGPALIAGRLITGALFDRFDMRLVSAISFGMPMLGCVLLLNLHGGDNYAIAAVAGVVVGLSIGAESDVLAYVTSRYFGLRRYGVLYAILAGLYGFGIGGGAALIGFLYDITHSYKPMLLGLGGCAVVAAVLVATLGRPPEHQVPGQLASGAPDSRETVTVPSA